MALSGSVAVRATSQNELIFSWAATQSLRENTSTISWQLLLVAKTYGQIIATPGSPWQVVIDGQTFSGTTSLAIENNQTKVLAAGQVTLAHETDGTREFAFSFLQEFHIKFDGESISKVSGSGEGILDPIARASQITASSQKVILGQPVTLEIQRQGDFTHTLEYSFGSLSGIIAEGITDGAFWTPPESLASQIPNDMSGIATVTCVTWDAAARIGTTQIRLTLQIPASMTPGVSGSWEDISGALAVVGAYVQGISRLSVTVSGTGIYGSTIRSASVTLDGKAYNGGYLTDSGERSLVVAVMDSRGQKAQRAYPLTVAAYSLPALTLDASRCRADGTADDTGDHALVRMGGHITQVNGRNSGALKLQWGSEQKSIGLEAGDFSLQEQVWADPDATLPITATLTDLLGAAVKTMVLSTGYATLDLLAGGKGIAFGKAATREGFECAMRACFAGGIYQVAPDGTVDSRCLFDRVAALEAKITEGEQL